MSSFFHPLFALLSLFYSGLRDKNQIEMWKGRRVHRGFLKAYRASRKTLLERLSFWLERGKMNLDLGRVSFVNHFLFFLRGK